MSIWESKELLDVIALFIEAPQGQRAVDTAEDIALQQRIARKVQQKLQRIKEQQHVQPKG
jgi:hypothetical protein